MFLGKDRSQKEEKKSFCCESTDEKTENKDFENQS